MKKTVKQSTRSKIRLAKEAIRMLSGSDSTVVAAGMKCPWDSCEMGATTTNTKPPI